MVNKVANIKLDETSPNHFKDKYRLCNTNLPSECLSFNLFFIPCGLSLTPYTFYTNKGLLIPNNYILIIMLALFWMKLWYQVPIKILNYCLD